MLRHKCQKNSTEYTLAPSCQASLHSTKFILQWLNFTFRELFVDYLVEVGSS